MGSDALFKVKVVFQGMNLYRSDPFHICCFFTADSFLYPKTDPGPGCYELVSFHIQGRTLEQDFSIVILLDETKSFVLAVFIYSSFWQNTLLLPTLLFLNCLWGIMAKTASLKICPE